MDGSSKTATRKPDAVSAPAATIVMLTCQFTEILGGAEKQCGNLSHGLRAKGTDVVILTSRVPGFEIPFREVGVRRFWTYRPPQLAGRHLPASLLWAVQVFFWIVLNRHRIAALHCHQLRINAYVAALANALFGIPTVMKLGCGGARNDFVITSQRKYGLGRAGTRFIIRHATRVVATAEQIHRDCLQWGVPPERIVRIVNGVDLSPVRGVPVGARDPRAEALRHEARFVFAGRLSDEKNAETIVRAVCRLEDGPPATLDILGDGPLADRIARLAPESGNVRLTMHGRVHDVFSHLRRAHFVMLLSWSEGLSNALLEAACAGVVPIVSDASGNRDVLPFEDYPFFVSGGRIEDVAAVVETARRMPPEIWRAWSESIASAARLRFDADTVRDRYLALYEDIGRSDAARSTG